MRGRLSEGRAGRGGESEGEEGESSDEGAERLMRAKADEVEPVKSSKKHHLDAPPEGRLSLLRLPYRFLWLSL